MRNYEEHPYPYLHEPSVPEATDHGGSTPHCGSKAQPPAPYYGCTRLPDHDGAHYAGVGGKRFVATWEDGE